MKDNFVSVEGINYKYITDISFHKGVNEHGHAVIKCVAEDEDAQNVLNLSAEAVWVNVKIGEKEGGPADTPVFSGIISSISVDTRQGVSEICIELIGGSYMMDVLKVTKTYQNSGAKLSKIVDTVKENCSKNFSGTSAKINKGKKCELGYEPEGKLLVQYEETDYQFLKRCASMQGLPLITSINATDPNCVNINIGLVEGGKSETLDTKFYKQEKQIAEFVSDKRAGLEGTSEEDYDTIVVRCREYMDIGTAVSINGKNMYVYSADSRYDSSHNTSKGSSNTNKDEFWHVYLLAGEKRFCQPRIYNYEMTGASLQSKVKEVIKAKLKIECDIDGKAAEDPLEFPYATVYSTNDGTGWYCMPEPDDVVRLYLPTEDEKDAYVISAVHLEEGTGLRNDPTHKFIMNKYKKQVEFTKETIKITNNDGLEIKMDDKKGISIISDKDIKINADKNIEMQSTGKKIKVSSQKEVLFKQGASSYIKLNGSATIKGNKVDIE
ncbi:MAG: DUF2345 domain-containing protein [Lachnospiraceae bacterium]|nr:DUF2345 domain-containing protein [Lachnospiraceae bacterium]